MYGDSIEALRSAYQRHVRQMWAAPLFSRERAKHRKVAHALRRKIRAERRDTRKDRRGDRQDKRSDRRDDRQDNWQDRQDNRQDSREALQRGTQRAQQRWQNVFSLGDTVNASVTSLTDVKLDVDTFDTEYDANMGPPFYKRPMVLFVGGLLTGLFFGRR
ncbi:MAG: hypothetical protein Q8Q85_00070 [Gemmatimonadales bacterium]|nr:hypothetical protein [Gemmatimonadales bacterium]